MLNTEVCSGNLNGGRAGRGVYRYIMYIYIMKELLTNDYDKYEEHNTNKEIYEHIVSVIEGTLMPNRGYKL